MNNATFIVGSRKKSYVKFYKKHKKDGKFDFGKYDIAIYSLKKDKWIG